MWRSIDLERLGQALYRGGVKDIQSTIMRSEEESPMIRYRKQVNKELGTDDVHIEGRGRDNWAEEEVVAV